METLALAASETAAVALPPPLTESQREWLRCRHWIERSLAKGRHPLSDTISAIEANVAAGHAVFWAGPDSALITRFDTFGAGKALVVVYAEGDGDKLEMAKRWVPQLEDFARYFSCKFLSVECQEEEFPLMEAIGLRAAFTTWIKEIPDAPTVKALAPAEPANTADAGQETA